MKSNVNLRYKNMKTLSIANQNGGVGKSTLAVHLAYAALEAGQRVLLVDMDKQGSLSLSFPPKADTTPGLVASGLYATEPGDAMPERIKDNLSIIRSDLALLNVDKAESKVLRFPAMALRRFEDDYDICIIDTPPLLGVRLIASLAASDFVVTPVSLGLYELAGVQDLIHTIHVVRTQGLNPKLRHVGILPMKTNTRSGKANQALISFRQNYAAFILAEGLPEREAVRQAVATRRPVWHGTKGAGHLKAAHEWKAACAAILGRVN
jgi:chromosome partitioning protein